MKYIVKYSPKAIEDLEEIYNNIVIISSDKKTADNFIYDINNKMVSRSVYPEANSLLNYNNVFTGYYFIPFKSYLIFFKIIDSDMVIARILHKRCDYISRLNLK